MAPDRRAEPLLLEAVAYRVTSYDMPFWVTPNRRSGRWNVAGQGVVQYLALDVAAPWAEMLRGENLADERDAALFRSTLWQVLVADQPIADYGTFEKAEAAGFSAEALVDDDHERCQNEARRLEGLGYRGILSPSAAIAGSRSLTLFGPRVAVPWQTTVRTASTLPAQKLATGQPPEGLTSRVRYRGTRHPDLEEFLARNRR